MKNRKGGPKGPRIRYYRHATGVVKARQRLAKRALFRNFVMIGLVAGALLGVYKHMQAAPLQRQDIADTTISLKTTETEQNNLIQAPKQAVEDESMGSFIGKQLKDMPKGQTWSVFVRDIKSDRMVSINADDSMSTASLYKLFLLPALENKLPAKNWNSRISKQSINDCVVAMIRVSDNDCGESIGNYVGWQYVDRYNQPLGFTNTKIGNTKQQTTAREAGDMMYRLQNSQLLSDKARRVVFDALYAQKYRQGVPAGCGVDCLVGNKTGEDGPVKHDVAVVTHGSAQYIVAIMSENASWKDVATVAKAVDQAMLP